MEAVIMCGGVGSRLRPLTETRPKPLVRFLGREILDRTLDVADALGIKDTHLALGYKAQEIVSHCENKTYRTRIHYHIEAKPLGTAGGVKNSVGESDGDVLVLSGDNVFDFDLSEAVDSHVSRGADVTIVCVETDDPREYGVVLTDDENRVTGFLEKPTWENAASFLINTGIYILSSKVLSEIPDDRPFDFAKDLFPRLIKDGFRVFCYPETGFWCDVGEPESLLRETLRLLPDCQNADHDSTFYNEDTITESGAKILAPSLLGKGSVLSAGAVIGPYAVLGNRCEIDEGAFVSRSICGDGVKLETNAEVCGAILDDAVRVGSHAVVEQDAVVGFGVQIGRFSRILGGCRIWPGNAVSPESIANRDLFYGAPKRIETDSFGVEGEVYTDLTLSDAVRIGQAVASLGRVRRVGVACSGEDVSVLYKDNCVSGVRSCGVIAYDFERVFFAQGFFYSAYCSLDAFIYISFDGKRISFSFLGKNGLPFDASSSRQINNHFRFSSFTFSAPELVGDLFRMHLLSTAYVAALRKTLGIRSLDRAVSVECDEPLIRSVLDSVLPKNRNTGAFPPLQIMLNKNGTELYCIENGAFFDASSIRFMLSEMYLAENDGLVVREDAPTTLEEIARRSRKTVIRIIGSRETADDPKTDVLPSLWNFDALFLCAALLKALSERACSLKEALSGVNRSYVRQADVPIDVDPGEIRGGIVSLGAVKTAAEDPYYTLSTAKGNVRVRQLGNSSRIRILTEAANMEAAKELSGDVKAKIIASLLDKKRN